MFPNTPLKLNPLAAGSTGPVVLLPGVWAGETGVCCVFPRERQVAACSCFPEAFEGGAEPRMLDRFSPLLEVVG